MPDEPCETPEPAVSVLIVDDNAPKRMALRAALEPLGYVVVEVDSGLAALRCVMKQDFAVILLDVRMPKMDGFETAARLRQRSQTEFTPIIFITAFGSDELVEVDRYAQGAVDFIFAPVEPTVLRGKVSAFGNLFKRCSTPREAHSHVRDIGHPVEAPHRRRPHRDLPDRHGQQVHLHEPTIVRDHRHRSRGCSGTGLGNDRCR